MDVDALSIKQREEALMTGACFKCGKIDHLAQDLNFHPRYEGQGEQWGNAGSIHGLYYICYLDSVVPLKFDKQIYVQVGGRWIVNGQLDVPK